MKSVMLSILVLALSAVCCQKVASAPSILSQTMLSADYSLFRRTLEEGHQGLYRYTTREKMDQILADGEQAVSQPMTPVEFYRILAPIVGSVKCGHIELFPPKEIIDESQKALFPFDVRVIDGRLYIVHDYSTDADTLAGREIVSVNGTPAGALLQKMTVAMPADANVASVKPYRLGQEGGFARMLQPIAGIGSPFQVVLRGKGGDENLAVEGLKQGRMDSLSHKRYGPGPSILHAAELEFMDGGKIALLKVHGFGGMGGIITPLGKYFGKLFERIQKARSQTLIIDVRGNDGGQHELGEALFSYLAAQPFRYYKDLILNSRTFSFLPYSEATKPIPPEAVHQGPDGRYHHDTQANWGIQQPRSPHFGGRILVLMNAGSFSATAEFLAMTRMHTNAVFIGEESGGAFSGNTSGMKYDITLPNSRIVLRTPVVGYYMDVDDRQPPDRGVQPDRLVRYSIEDMVKRSDKEMAVALDLARGK